MHLKMQTQDQLARLSYDLPDGWFQLPRGTLKLPPVARTTRGRHLTGTRARRFRQMQGIMVCREFHCRSDTHPGGYRIPM